MDNVGNVSNISDAFEITNVDGEIDYISLTGDPEDQIVRTVTLYGEVQDKGSGIINYGHFDVNNPTTGWQPDKPATDELITEEREVTKNGTYYFCAKDALDNNDCAEYTVDNIDRKVPDLTLEPSTTSYVTDLTFTATATDNADSSNVASGIAAYRIVTPTVSYNWTNVDIEDSTTLSTTISATNNGTYYFYVRDKAGNETQISKTIGNIVVLTSTRTNLYSETSSNISKTVSISNLVLYDRVVSDNGTVTGSKSGNSVRLNASGGRSDTYTQLETFIENPDTYPAHSYTDEECYCDSGGRLSGGYCVDSNYSFSGQYGVICRDPSGMWGLTYDNTDRACDRGYVKESECDEYPTDPCTVNETKYVHCEATCVWQKYSPTCEDYEVYYCDRGDIQSGRYTCKTCNRGSLNYNEKCQYQDYVTHTYWEYNVTIYYYKIK